MYGKPSQRLRGFIVYTHIFFMFNFEVNEAVIVEQRRALEAALSTNPDTEKALRKVIRKVILDARKEVISDIQGKFPNDPRRFVQSVRTTVYKKVLGANINIFNNRKAHSTTSYEPPRTLKPEKPGGNRLPRSSETQRIMSYGPLDRGFILRFQNQGTKQRKSRYGNRGTIDGKGFFHGAGLQELTKAADNLANIIDQELSNILNKRKKA